MRRIQTLICLLMLLFISGKSEGMERRLTPAQGDNDLWGYKNEAGEWAFEPQWDYVGVFRDGVAVVEWEPEDENAFFTYGILRDDGTWILPRGEYIIQDRFYYDYPDFDIAEVDEQALIGGLNAGFLLIGSDTPDELRMGFYCIPTDTLVMPCWNEVLFSMNHAENILIPVCDPETYLWGYVDWYGQVVIPCQYVYAECFYDGYANVATETEDFVIDLNGNPVEMKMETVK